MRLRGADARYRLDLEFLDAVNGARKSITLADGGALEVAIPPGTRDGQVLRLRGKGMPGIAGGPPSDALIEVRLRAHHLFSRRGDDIHVELPMSLKRAVLGGKAHRADADRSSQPHRATLVEHGQRASARRQGRAAA